MFASHGTKYCESSRSPQASGGRHINKQEIIISALNAEIEEEQDALGHISRMLRKHVGHRPGLQRQCPGGGVS